MAERLILHPPEIIDTDRPVIFLAGPIQGAPDWQIEAADTIHNLDPSIIVASPRKNYPEGTFVYERQVDWETHFLRQAGKTGVVAFWLASPELIKLRWLERIKLASSLLIKGTLPANRAYAQTSRFELAEWKMRHERDENKLAIGIGDGFGNARYIRRRFSQDCPDVTISDNLPEMCLNAVHLLSEVA